MTWGTERGRGSDARPSLKLHDPGCSTITFSPTSDSYSTCKHNTEWMLVYIWGVDEAHRLRFPIGLWFPVTLDRETVQLCISNTPIIFGVCWIVKLRHNLLQLGSTDQAWSNDCTCMRLHIICSCGAMVAATRMHTCMYKRSTYVVHFVGYEDGNAGIRMRNTRVLHNVTVRTTLN